LDGDPGGEETGRTNPFSLKVHVPPDWNGVSFGARILQGLISPPGTAFRAVFLSLLLLGQPKYGPGIAMSPSKATDQKPVQYLGRGWGIRFQPVRGRGLHGLTLEQKTGCSNFFSGSRIFFHHSRPVEPKKNQSRRNKWEQPNSRVTAWPGRSPTRANHSGILRGIRAPAKTVRWFGLFPTGRPQLPTIWAPLRGSSVVTGMAHGGTRPKGGGGLKGTGLLPLP